MAVIIDTSTKHAGLWGSDPYGIPMDGFTSGNLAGGIQPTQLSSEWFNSVQQSINNCIVPGVNFALDGTESGHDQLGFAIENQIIQRKPYWQTGVTYTFRSQGNLELLTTPGRTSGLMERTSFNALAAGSITTVLTLGIPNNSQSLCEFVVTCVQTDSPSNYANIVLRVSARNTANVVAVQGQTTSYSDIPFVGWSALAATSPIRSL